MSPLAIDKINTAELAIPSKVSSAGLSVVGPAQAAASADSASVALSLSGAAEASLSSGSAHNGSGFVIPEIGAWHIIGSNGGDLTKSTLTVVAPTYTTGDICTVQFAARVGAAVAVTLSVSAPEQTTPHAASGDTRSQAYMGQWCDLYWRWWSGSESHDYELVGSGVVYIPSYNGIDFESSG